MSITYLQSTSQVLPSRQPRPSYAVERWLDIATVVGLLTVTGIVTGWGLNHYPALNGDEGIYTSQARAILHGSIAPYTYTYDHPFFGWLQISVLAAITQMIHLGGNLSVINDRYVMLGYALANTGLLYGIARRLQFNRIISTVTVALFALSPLTIDLARQVYLDNIAVPWATFAVFLLLNPKRSQWVYASAGAAFAIGVLSKETVLLYLPGLVYLLVQRTDQRLRTMCYTAFGAIFSLGVLIYPLFALLRNELLPGKGHVSLWTNGVMYQLSSRSGSGALWLKGTARDQLWDGWMTFDKVLIVSGCIAAVFALTIKAMRPFVLMLVCVMAPIVKPGGYLPAMYIIAALPLCALLVGGVLSGAWSKLERMANTRRSRWDLIPLTVGVAVFAVLVGGLVCYAGEHYSSGDQPLLTTNAVAPYAETEAWIARNVAPATINGKLVVQNVLTDDAFSTDLYRMGLGPWQAVSYYKYDLDPTAAKKLPGGYHDIAYIIDTPQMRSDITTQHLVKTEAAIQHSTLVATFGDSDSRIQILQVNP